MFFFFFLIFPEDFVPEDFILIRAPTMGFTGYSGWDIFQVWTFLKFWSWVPPDRAPTTPSTWLNSFQWMDGFFFPRGLCPRGLYPDQGTNHGIHRLQWLGYFSGLDIFEILELGASWQSTNHAFNLVELLPMDGWIFFFPEDFVPEDFILIRAPTMGFTGYPMYSALI